MYFIDDMNMPEVDAYGTVQPHTLLRQHFDYKHWYDRQRLTVKEVSNCQYVSCMNPSAGSFTIDPRLQRHFNVFALSFPGLVLVLKIDFEIKNFILYFFFRNPCRLFTIAFYHNIYQMASVIR